MYGGFLAMSNTSLRQSPLALQLIFLTGEHKDEVPPSSGGLREGYMQPSTTQELKLVEACRRAGKHIPFFAILGSNVV